MLYFSEVELVQRLWSGAVAKQILLAQKVNIPMIHHCCFPHLQPLLEERQTMRSSLLSDGIVKYWSDIVTHSETGVDKEVRQAAMHLMCELWTQLPEGIEAVPELPNILLGLLKKGARDSHLSVQITSLTSLFKLLIILHQQI